MFSLTATLRFQSFLPALLLFGNGVDRTSQFYDDGSNFSVSEPNLVLSRENDTLEAYFPSSGILH